MLPDKNCNSNTRLKIFFLHKFKRRLRVNLSINSLFSKILIHSVAKSSMCSKWKQAHLLNHVGVSKLIIVHQSVGAKRNFERAPGQISATWLATQFASVSGIFTVISVHTFLA